MIFKFRKCFKSARIIACYSNFASQRCACAVSSRYSPSNQKYFHSIRARIDDQEEQSVRPIRPSDLDVLISKVNAGNSDDQLLQSLMLDQACNHIKPSHDLIDKLLQRFKDDWKSALGFFKWAGSCSDFKHLPEAYDMMVDILGKAKQMDRMNSLLEEMCEDNFVTLNSVGKAMRRLCGAGHWEDAVMIFDKLGSFGLKKDTETMNILLDTLCKEKKVEQARKIFLELKSHIAPSAHTFNIFIHGWCKVGRVEEAQWTLQEMKGSGFRPCVISYSTIIEFYCRQANFNMVYEVLDSMEAKDCTPNVITFTAIMCSLTKSEEFEEALQIADRMRLAGCKPDALFYNALIHTLGRAGRIREAIHVFKVEMPKTGVSPNTSTYNSMIAMFCHHGHYQQAFDTLNEIESSTLCKPDVQTYYPLLKSCFKTGKTDSCLRKLLDDMINKHHLSLDISAYSLLIHGLCRANKCEWAYSLFEEMLGQEVTPRYQTCRLLLDECKQKSMYVAAEKIENVRKHI